MSSWSEQHLSFGVESRLSRPPTFAITPVRAVAVAVALMAHGPSTSSASVVQPLGLEVATSRGSGFANGQIPYFGISLEEIYSTGAPSVSALELVKQFVQAAAPTATLSVEDHRDPEADWTFALLRVLVPGADRATRDQLEEGLFAVVEQSEELAMALRSVAVEFAESQ